MVETDSWELRKSSHLDLVVKKVDLRKREFEYGDLGSLTFCNYDYFVKLREP